MKQTTLKMNIDKIIQNITQYNYLDRVEESLSALNLTFTDLKHYRRSGSSRHGIPDPIFKQTFGSDAKLPEIKRVCLCGHSIVEQCYLCPKDSNNPDDIIVLGNHCIKKWGFTPAIRGKGKKVECDVCGAVVNKAGITRHKKTTKCKNNTINKVSNDSTTESTNCSDSGSVSSGD